MKIPYVNLTKQWKSEKKYLLKIIDKVLSTGNYVGGAEIQNFESSVKNICNVKHVVALNSGTDALTLALKSIGIKKGDEVITPPNSFISSTSSIIHLGAKPIFVDVKDDQNIDYTKIEKSITSKTKAIMPVHLTGRMCDMDQISKISKKYKIPIIEDAAQSIGSKFNKIPAGSYSKIGCFSAHPLKNLNAFGDAGFITTNDSKIAKSIRTMSNHGMVNRNKVFSFGYLSRLDNLQAAILNFHIKKLHSVINQRRANASIYKKYLDTNNIYFPQEEKKFYDTYHTFVIQVKKRNSLMKHLAEKGIGTSIHYPIPIHLQKASKSLNYKQGDFPVTEKQSKLILSLPINQFLRKNEIIYICNTINNYFNK